MRYAAYGEDTSILAGSLKRDFEHVYVDVMFLADLGLIELKAEDRRKTLIPIVRFSYSPSRDCRLARA